jgi:hypothetical protein
LLRSGSGLRDCGRIDIRDVQRKLHVFESECLIRLVPTTLIDI